MPQYRKLHVKATESLDINEMPDDFTRLLWVMLPLGLCRDGRGMDNPAWIKAKIMPLRTDVTLSDIEGAMVWFDGAGMIERYVVDGRSYFQVTNWQKYQGATSKEAESPYPPASVSKPERGANNFSGGASPELVKSLSGTDTTTDTTTNADTDTTTDTDGGSRSGDFAEVVKAYENNIGGITPKVSELIGDAVDTYPFDWIIDAIGIAVKNNSLKWGYVEGVLKNWKKHGRGYSPKVNGRNGHHPINQTMDEILSTAFD